MVDQQFCLRWNNHKSTLISVFDTLLENNVLVDCTLAAEGQYLKAHKVVLCACSPYLERILSQHTERHPILILKDVKYQELKCMMDYMYKGEVNISQEQLETFLKAAESLQIKGLTDSGSKDDYRVANHSKRQEQTRKPPSIQLVSSTSPVSTPYSHSSALNELNVRQTSTSNVDAPLDASPNSRDRSLSPVPRKKKRPRRPSQTDSEHFDSASETPVQIQSTPMINVPLANQILSTSTSSTINDGTDQSLTVADIARFTGVLSTENIKKEKIESQPDNLIVPKTEFLDDVNEDGVEDLTLEEDIENMDGGPGPSHSSENSNQGYGWSIAGERSTDEIFTSQDLANTAQDNQEKKGRRGRPPGSKNRKTALKKNDSNEIYYYGDWCSPDEDNWQANSKVKRNRGRPPKRETIVKAELEQEYLNYPYFDENKQADLANRLNISVAYVSRWYEKRKNDMGRPRRGRPRKSVDTFSGSPIFCQTVLEGDSENGHFSDAYFTAEERNILYNDFQKTELMKEFRKSPYISINEETALSKKLGLSEFQIRAWFSRMRFKANFSDSSAELTVGDFSNDDDDDRIKEEQANDNSIADGAIESNVTGFQSELDNDPNNVVNSSSAGSSPTHSIEQLTSEQVEKLEATYSISPTISYVMLNNLSNELRVSKKCIDDWFRAKRDDSKTESIVNVTDL